MGGLVVPVTTLTIGSYTGPAYDVNFVSGGGDCSFTIAVALNRAVIAGELVKFELQQANAMGQWLALHSVTVAPGQIAPPFPSTVSLTGVDYFVALRVVVNLNTKSGYPLSLDQISITMNPEVGTTWAGTTSTVGVGLSQSDLDDIRGIVRTGTVSLLGMAVWFEFSGTMQQNGTFAIVEKPSQSVGSFMLDRSAITSLQKSPRYSYNGPLNKGFIGFLAPTEIDEYGKLHMEGGGGNPSWQSIYGAYSAITTAAGSDLPQINIKWSVVLGYVPDNVLVMPSNCPFHPMDVTQALIVMSQFVLLHQNHGHKASIKKALEVASKATRFAVKHGPLAAKVATMLSSML
jgi:hypothetical protein